MSYKFTKEELEELLIDYNKIAIKELKLDVPSEVCIWDETLRDGEQSPTVYLTLDEKIHLAKLLDEIGVKLIAVEGQKKFLTSGSAVEDSSQKNSILYFEELDLHCFYKNRYDLR